MLMQAPRLISRSSCSLQSAGTHCCHPRAGSSRRRHGSMVVAASRGSSSSSSSSSKRPPLRKQRNRAAAESAAASLARTITNMITNCRSIIELSDECDKCSGSFDYRHTATALIKAAQLPSSDFDRDDCQAAAQEVLDRLAAQWEEQLPAAGATELATVLWICSQRHNYLSNRKSLWSSTVAAFMRRNRGKAAAQEYSNVLRAMAVIGTANKGVVPGLTRQEVLSVFKKLTKKVLVMAAAPAPAASFQVISDTLWAHTKLGIQLAPAQLSGLLEAAVRPQLLDGATAQGLGDLIGAVVRQADLGGRVRVPKVAWQQLRAAPQLQKLRLSPGESTTSVVRRAARAL